MSSRRKSSRRSRRSRSKRTTKINIRYNSSRSSSTKSTKRIARSSTPKMKQITFRPLNGKKIYCGGLDVLPSDEYERFGTRRECLDKGYGLGRNLEYNYIRSLLIQEGYEIPEKKRYEY